MKKVIAALLAVIMLCSACSGIQKPDTSISGLRFFYCVKGTDGLESDIAVDSEERSIQIFTLPQLLELYFRGPTSDQLRSPFPDGTELVSVAEGESGLELTLSVAFFTLTGIELSIASYCLASTVCDYLGTDHVILMDEMQRIRMDVSPENFLLENNYHADSESVFTLYFPESTGRYLVGETREVILSENESEEKYMLRQLLLGPRTQGLKDIMPADASILSVETDGGICTVDLSEPFYSAYSQDTYGAYMAIYSIVNTLTGLERVSEVQFLKEGQSISHFNIFNLSVPIPRYSGSIENLRSGGSEVDMFVYVISIDDSAFFGVPVRVKQTIAQPFAEAAAQAAISSEVPEGFYNPIPYGTELLGISVSGSVCYVDVSIDFIPSDGTEFSERAAVWALVTSLTDHDNISSVVLTIEGESGGLQYVDLTQPLTAEIVAFH